MIFQVPTGETLTFGDENFTQFEETGVREARKAAFVLVAGGLGERLGYSGIKVYLFMLCHLLFAWGDILCIRIPEKLMSLPAQFWVGNKGCCCLVKINSILFHGV